MGGQPCYRIDCKWKPRCEVVTVASNEPHARAIPPPQNTKSIVLNFVQPARTGRRGLRWRWQTGLNDPQPWAGTLTQRHSGGRYKAAMRAMQNWAIGKEKA